MIFENLSLFQNILFLVACLSAAMVIIFLILSYSGLHNSKLSGESDDFDHSQEERDDPKKFVANALTLKGSIFLIAITSSVGFFLSLFMAVWLGLLIGFILGLVAALSMAFFDREKVLNNGKVGLISEEVPENLSGMGKVILLEEGGAELDAVTYGKTLKKGKKVMISEEKDTFVVVKKFKRQNKECKK